MLSFGAAPRNKKNREMGKANVAFLYVSFNPRTDAVRSKAHVDQLLLRIQRIKSTPARALPNNVLPFPKLRDRYERSVSPHHPAQPSKALDHWATQRELVDFLVDIVVVG